MKKINTLLQAVLWLTAAILLGGLAQQSRAATFEVNSAADIQDAVPGDGLCQTAFLLCTLRAAISEANALPGDDVITLPAGTYTITMIFAGEDLNAGGDFDFRSNITLNGAGAGSTFIQGASTAGATIERVFQFISGTSTVRGVTLRNGGTLGAANANGGGLAIAGGQVTLDDCSVTNNAASLGGGINVVNGGLTLNRTYVGNNQANVGGGIRIEGGTGTFVNQSAVQGNNAGSGGGILNTNGFIYIRNSSVVFNIASSAGSGILNLTTSPASNAQTDMNFVTIGRNHSNSAAGIENLNLGGTTLINLKNSVAADNTPIDIGNNITSQGYNHVENFGTNTFVTTTGDVTGTDPLLGTWIINGSNTAIFPAANSPLIDAIPDGVNGCGAAPFNVDQLGAMRPLDSNGDMTPACEKGAVERLASPTAASVSISGRVLAEERGLSGAIVILTNAVGESRTARTNTFGFFRFEEVTAGETYVLTVSSKRYRFTPQVISVNDNISNLNLLADL